MLKMFGHAPQLLYILDGGLSAWERYEGKLEAGEQTVAAKSYAVNFQEKYYRNLAQMKANLHHPQEQVVDARPAIRYTGGPEPRPGVRSGHIPGSFCFPFIVPFEANGCFLPLEKIRRRLEGIGLDLQHPTTTLCGSGMTAAIINFLFDILGNENNALYNGSWTEWGAEALYPGEHSLAERPVATCV
jgi:thiosulfate/3-mercaptopyruvate sulfurtransferase